MKVAFVIMSLIIGSTATHAEHLIVRNPVVTLDQRFPAGNERFYATMDISLCMAAVEGNFSAYVDKGVVEMIGTRTDISYFQTCLIKMGADLPSGTPRNEAISAR